MSIKMKTEKVTRNFMKRTVNSLECINYEIKNF